MKIVVDALPKQASECCFASKGTGKYRCRWNALLCPVNRSEACPYLVEQTPVIADPVPDPNAVVEKAVPKTRSRRKG